MKRAGRVISYSLFFFHRGSLSHSRKGLSHRSRFRLQVPESAFSVPQRVLCTLVSQIGVSLLDGRCSLRCHQTQQQPCSPVSELCLHLLYSRSGISYANISFDVRPWIVVFQNKVLILEIKQALHVWVEFHRR